MRIIKVVIIRVIVKSYNESDSENDSNGNNQSEKGSDNQSENSVYWCFDEASEYKGWVIKLVLTTPVKFQEKVKFSFSLSTLNTLRLFISLYY